jgi:hypothetical protein
MLAGDEDQVTQETNEVDPHRKIEKELTGKGRRHELLHKKISKE